MDRKLFAWLLICISMFLLFNSMQRQKEIARLEQEKQTKLGEETKEKKKAQSKEAAERLAGEDPDFALPQQPTRERFTLGSMDPKDNYQLLVTLDNQGAAIERIELMAQKSPGIFEYRSLHSKGREGYLGHLALVEATSSLEVNSVPKGSAAASAKCKENPNLVGLLPGDKIVGWDGLTGFPSITKLDNRFSDQSAGETIELKVLRDITNVSEPVQAEGTSDTQVNETAVKQNDAPVVGAAPVGTELTFDCILTEKPLDVLRAEDDFNQEQVHGNDPVASCATTLASVDQISIEDGERAILGLENTLKGRWKGKPLEMSEGMGVEFSMPLRSYLKLAGIKANLELVKQYRLLPAKRIQGQNDPSTRQQHLELTTIVRNLDDEAHTVSIRQEGLNGISLEGWWYPTKISPFFFSAAGARDLIVSDGFASHSLFTTRSIVSHAISSTAEPDMSLFGAADSLAKRSIHYIGLDTQTFTAAMLPSPSEPSSLQDLKRGKATVHNSVYADSNKLPSSKQQAANIGFWFESDAARIAAKGEWKQSYQIFAGPKDPELLAAYKLDEAIEYGWHIFGFFAKRLGYILHFFFWLTGNFGIAIIMLTVLVRSCMFPVSRMMALNAQKMQSVQPQLAKLKEALKEDPRKMMAAQQMLMKKAGINQFAGCLPALIQLPIVIGLYRCVSVDVGLRQQSLFPGWDWCSNLAGPDMFNDWQSWMPEFIAGRGSGWFGPYLNILPIVTISLFIIQQKVLMPKATDEQTRVAQQMMMVMTIMMGVLFFKVPAGLCIYFITSSTWSLVERFLIKRFTPKSSMIVLPENAVNDIIATLAKSATPQQRVATSPSNSDRPKMKATKPPETLADIFPKWFGKKPESSPAINEKSKRTSAGPPERGNKKKKR